MTRFGWIMATYVSILAVGGMTGFHPAPRLIWNVTASTPTGLYALQPAGDLKVGELVSVMPPGHIASFLADGGFLPKSVPLLKHVMALPGQTVCRIGRVITIDGITMGEAHERDSRGRALPAWDGCQIIAKGKVFLMNPAVPDSLDGRYFGPLPTSSIIGRAVPLWTEKGQGNAAPPLRTDAPPVSPPPAERNPQWHKLASSRAPRTVILAGYERPRSTSN